VAERDIDRLIEIEELFADLWQVPRFSGLRAGFRPQVDVFRTADPPTLTVVVELPGVDPARVEVVVAEGELRISGERPRPREPGRQYERMELDYGPFERHIRLSEDVDVAAATAEYEAGMLTIVLPIVRPQPRRVRTVIDVHRVR
jgi:HSP20 family protein